MLVYLLSLCTNLSSILLFSSKFCVFKIAYSLEFVYNPPMNARGAFVVIHRHVQSVKKFWITHVHIPGWDWEKPGSALFQLSHCKQESFRRLLSTMFFAFSVYVLLLVIAILTTTPNIVLKWCLVFPSARRLGCVLHRENACQINFVQVQVTVLLAVSSMLMNQQWTSHKVNKMSWNRNTHKSRFYIDQSTKIWPEALRNRTLYFP